MAEGSHAAEVAASFDAMFGGISLQTLLLDHTLYLPIDSHFPPLPLSLLPPPPLSSTDHYPSDSAVTSSSIALKPPKPEPLYISDDPNPAADQPSPLLLPLVDHTFHTAHPASDSVAAAGSQFRRKQSTTRTTAFKPASRRAATSRNNLMARQRRRRISEKMKCLKKLMPWNRKMDTATLLEEAHKYILFLEAQVSAIHSMPGQADHDPLPLQYLPVDDNYQVNDYSAADDSVGFVRPAVGLNRQQALQVVVNSPAAQSVLYSQGQCVVSEEQMDMAMAAAMPRHQQQEEQSLMMMMMMMMFDSSSSASSLYY